MYHPNSGISTIADLNGKTIAVTPGASYWLYLKKKYNITNAHEVNYTGSIASFASDSSLSQQCFYTNEPFQATEQKIPHSVFLVSETGWASYSDTLFTTTSEVSSHADVVRNLVQAFEDGWKDYLANPQPVFTYLTQQGDKETPAQMSYVQDSLKTKFNAGKLGNNDPTRMKDVATQLQSIGLLPSTFDYTPAFTNTFRK
jgi:NitT/TauT family transport system substrate-binding protein